MAVWGNAIITNKGLVLLAKLTSGTTLSLTRAVAGAGRVDPAELKNQTEVAEEKQNLTFGMQSYSSKSQELLTGTVLRVDPTGDVFVQIGQGNEQNNAVLRTGEQIPGESYEAGDLIRVYVLEVSKAPRGPLVQVSRTHPNVVRRLFVYES